MRYPMFSGGEKNLCFALSYFPPYKLVGIVWVSFFVLYFYVRLSIWFGGRGEIFRWLWQTWQRPRISARKGLGRLLRWRQCRAEVDGSPHRRTCYNGPQSQEWVGSSNGRYQSAWMSGVRTESEAGAVGASPRYGRSVGSPAAESRSIFEIRRRMLIWPAWCVSPERPGKTPDRPRKRSVDIPITWETSAPIWALSGLSPRSLCR